MAKSQYTHDVVATIGTYKGADGSDKKNYLNVGKAFTDDQGRLSFKLDAIPVTPEWSGWFSLYERKERGQQQARSQRPARPAPLEPEEDDIPY